MRTLVVTVGGSPEPICTSIESLGPDRVIFLCSGGKAGSKVQVDGEGTPCEIRKNGEIVERRPNLVRQLSLGDYEIEVLEDPDDIAGWYTLTAKVLERALKEGAEVLADYTGGTKTMSAALLSAALDWHVPLYLTSRARTNLAKVDFGQSTELAETRSIHADRSLRLLLPSLLEAFDYTAAVALIQNLETQGRALGDDRQRIKILRDICRALEAWDRFDHESALRYLELQARHGWVRDNLMYRASNLVAARAELEGADAEPKPRHHGYEPVWDLVLNADRRATQKRYDDAVGRLYRALELMAQTRLRKAHAIRTAGVEPTALPESVRAAVLEGKIPDDKSGRVRLGLFDAWTVLTGFPNDPLGRLFAPREGELQRVLEARNHSLFAHGFRPITSETWREFRKVVSGFLTEALGEVVKKELPPQLPGPIPDPSTWD